MSKKVEIRNGIIVRKQFTVDKDFIDPLLPLTADKIKLDQFEEVEIEEVHSYYSVHLGVPQTHEEI